MPSEAAKPPKLIRGRFVSLGPRATGVLGGIRARKGPKPTCLWRLGTAARGPGPPGFGPDGSGLEIGTGPRRACSGTGAIEVEELPTVYIGVIGALSLGTQDLCPQALNPA